MFPCLDMNWFPPLVTLLQLGSYFARGGFWIRDPSVRKHWKDISDISVLFGLCASSRSFGLFRQPGMLHWKVSLSEEIKIEDFDKL